MSNTKRLLVGFGVIALGVCAALPFRRAPGREDLVTGPVRNDLEFGKDLPLQVPGQKVIARLQTPAAAPTLGAEQVDAEDAAPKQHVGNTEPAEHRVDHPPALPDEYQPLFRARNTSTQGSGVIVVSPSARRAPRPLRRHRIRDGDTLASLAERYLGSADRALEIFRANRGVLTTPELLPIGVTVIIPRREVPQRSAGGSTGTDPPESTAVSTPLEPLPRTLLQNARHAAY